MMKLTVAAFLTNLQPTVGFDECDKFFYFHGADIIFFPLITESIFHFLFCSCFYIFSASFAVSLGYSGMNSHYLWAI